MAGSTRAELASSGLDASSFAATYPSGQRGTYSASNLERSGSFRESLENRIMVSGPGASRNTAPSMEIPPVSQYLTLEPISMSEQKYTRSGELRRVLGLTVEEHSFGSVQSKPLPPIASEELKRFKASVLESSNRARDRAKFLHESILKLDKYRNILSRKRQRSEPSSEKSGSANLLKMGGQAHQNPAEAASSRLEDRTKNVVPNKRVRSSMAELEGRGAVPVRQGTTTDKDKNILRGCNGGPMPSEDKIRGLPPGGDGLEKKLKRKRSVGTMVNRVTEGDRDIKQAIQQRPNNEPRPRSCDNLGFRPGSSSGIVGSNKIDGSSQLSGGSSRVMPRNDLDNCSLSNERRERSAGLDKERIIAKGNNKLNAREDAQPGSQSPLTKGKASRAPRTGSAAIMNAASNFPRTSGGIDGWEQAPSLSKVQPLTGVTNRKRPMPAGSSSPPVTQWGGQRPQKISRTRRANVVSPVSNFDEAQISPEGFVAPDVGARLTTLESGGPVPSRGISHNTLQSNLKPDNLPSPAGLSESEESGAIGNKLKEKGIDNGELEDGPLNTVHKTMAVVLPTKKNKVPSKEEIGDGVRRQGRSGRGSMQAKACLTLMKEKSEHIDTAKPLKSGRPGSDKSESRVGRPPSKKVSDRKAYSRPAQIINSGSSDLTGELDDDREEMLAAANAARNASCVHPPYNACSSSFWKKMEPIFAFVTSEDITYVKNQIYFVEEIDESLSNMLDVAHDRTGELACQTVLSPHSSFSIEQSQTNVVGPNKSVGNLSSVDVPKHANTACGKVETEKWLEKIVPLSQRLLSAFISEEGTEQLDCDMEQGDTVLQFSSDYFPYGTNSNVQNEHEAHYMKSGFEMDLEFKNQKNRSGDSIPCNGFMMSSNFRSSNIHNFISGDEVLAENSIMKHSDNGSLSEFGQTNSNHLLTMGTSFSGTSTYECQFEHMSLDDRVLMELHSIGLYPESVPDLAEGDDCEIGSAISELKMEMYRQVMKKKNQLHSLEKAIQNVKEIEERNLEQLAMNKLVEMAYKKLMGGRGSHGSSHKSGVSKVSKQLALAFAKRTLARCQKFEETGRSCFSEPAFRCIILSAPLHSSDGKYADGIASGTATNIYGESRSCQLGSRVSASGTLASGVTSSMPERHGISYKIDRGPLDSYQGLSHMSDQAFVKNDPASNRGKKREVLLDDVVTSAASRAPPTLTNTLPGGPKWKRTDRERDPNKDELPRNSTAKAGRPSLSSGRGERKTKTKPKQKIAQLSTSGNGLGRVMETASFMLPSGETMNIAGTEVDQEIELQSSGNAAQNLSREVDDNIFPKLPLHGIDSIDELDVAEGLGGQGQDIGSWLNVDEDTLQDDLVGLEIPMDDLSELKLNF
ncbi:uncharacterized protein LOC103703090 isoform X3 [Phoenix dactylifera]|uniref:Uncharacterized protein LOC103703090 isoform X3 n=1 Tax=Phoenix dactylifera TaxID=42345 RepID=A0A8B7BRQ5_PHODC|nr:uncharacterized protein LOC103703090 isoform X3 [Phoenix dactylifera]